MYKLPGSNLQYVTSITFLLTTYSKYMAARKQTFNCGSLVVTPRALKILAKQQVYHLIRIYTTSQSDNISICLWFIDDWFELKF